MITYKYKKEYELELETVNGKVKQKYKYIGPYFGLEEKIDHRKATVFLLIIYIVFAAAIFLNLYLYSNMAKTWYIIIPTGFNAVTAYISFSGLFVFWPKREKLTREQKDKGINKLKTNSFFKIVFSFWVLTGIIFFMANYSGTKVPQDRIFLINTGIMVLVSIIEFLILHKIKLKEN